MEHTTQHIAVMCVTKHHVYLMVKALYVCGQGEPNNDVPSVQDVFKGLCLQICCNPLVLVQQAEQHSRPCSTANNSGESNECAFLINFKNIKNRLFIESNFVNRPTIVNRPTKLNEGQA